MTTHKRRAFTPDQLAQIKLASDNASSITSDDLANGGKKNPKQGIGRGFMERTKVWGVIEETDNGDIYLSKFEGKPEVEGEGEPAALETVDTAKAVEETCTWYCPIVKAEAVDDQRLVTGIVLMPETVDAQLDIYDAGVIKDAAHNFLREYNAGNVIGFMHKEMNRSLDLVESWIAPVNLKIGSTSIKKGTWMMTVNVVDESIWESVKDGKIAGFSIGGVAKVMPLDDNGKPIPVDAPSAP